MTPGTTIAGSTGTWITRMLQSGLADAVVGQTGAGTLTAGVRGVSTAFNGNGGILRADNGTSAFGVWAIAAMGRAVVGDGGTHGARLTASSAGGLGVEAFGTAVGVLGRGTAVSSRGVEGQTGVGDWGGIFFGPAPFNSQALASVGQFVVFNGLKLGAVPIADGKQHVSLYTVESPEAWFEDIGGARLDGGWAVVPLDPIFAQTVNTKITYRVFLTPNGNCNIYVAVKTAESFTVGLLQGQPDCEFDYRVMAKRLGAERYRLDPIDMPQRTEVAGASAPSEVTKGPEIPREPEAPKP